MGQGGYLDIDLTEGLEMAEGLYDGESAEGVEELEGIEEAEIAAVDAGQYDKETSLEGIRRTAKSRVKGKAKKATRKGVAKVATRVANYAQKRVLTINRVVPLDIPGVAAGGLAAFNYEPPDECRMLGIVAEPVIRAAFKIRTWKYGTTDLIENAGLDPATSTDASMAICDPQSPISIKMQIGFGRLLGKNAAKLQNTFVNGTGAPADFVGAILLNVPKKSKMLDD